MAEFVKEMIQKKNKKKRMAEVEYPSLIIQQAKSRHTEKIRYL